MSVLSTLLSFVSVLVNLTCCQSLTKPIVRQSSVFVLMLQVILLTLSLFEPVFSFMSALSNSECLRVQS